MELAGPEPELQSGRPGPDPFLEDFQRLGQQIFYYEPASTQSASTSATREPSTSPQLLILCSWMGASSRNVRKYLSTYQVLFPTTRILLLKQDGGDFFWRTKAMLAKNLQPALSVIKDVADQDRLSRPRILLHIFSNGGSFTAIRLTDFYLQLTGAHLPISAFILDSTPSLPSARRAHEAISESLPRSGPLRTLGQGALWAYIGAGKTIDVLRGAENITLYLRRKLNDAAGPFTQGNLRRVYIYSQADKLVPGADVEAHAEDAKAIIGAERVQLEDFVTSRHVGHIMVDGDRYWRIVEGFWRDCVGNEHD